MDCPVFIWRYTMEEEVKTTGWAGGLNRPYKGLVPASALRALKTWQSRLCYRHAALIGRLLFVALFCRLTRKRVYELLHTDLVCYLVFAQLVLDVFLNCSFITPHSIDKIPSAPEMSVPIFVFQICKSIKNHQCTFPFSYSHESWYRHLRRYWHQHVNMIYARLRLQYLHIISLANGSEYFSNFCFLSSINNLSTVFRCYYYVILTSPFRVC